MKVAVFSDIHNNLVRLTEVAKIIKKEGISIGICCGDFGSMETLEKAAKPFKTLYFVLGNMDHSLRGKEGFFPENTVFWEKIGEFELAGKKLAIVHHDYLARDLAKSGKYDAVFYGHTHTPWEKKVGRTVLLNPGEIAGEFGRASFAIYDLSTMKAKLKLLK